MCMHTAHISVMEKTPKIGIPFYIPDMCAYGDRCWQLTVLFANFFFFLFSLSPGIRTIVVGAFLKGRPHFHLNK